VAGGTVPLQAVNSPAKTSPNRAKISLRFIEISPLPLRGYSLGYAYSVSENVKNTKDGSLCEPIFLLWQKGKNFFKGSDYGHSSILRHRKGLAADQEHLNPVVGERFGDVGTIIHKIDFRFRQSGDHLPSFPHLARRKDKGKFTLKIPLNPAKTKLCPL